MNTAVWVLWAGLILSMAPVFTFATDEQPQTVQGSQSGLDFETLNSEIQAAIMRAKPACVAAAERRVRGTGGDFSAVIVSPEGHLLTAAHCVTPGSDYLVTLSDGRRLSATGLGASPILDCGMIKIDDAKNLPFVELGSSAGLKPNQPCLSISHPSGLDPDRGLVIRFGRVVGRNRRGHIHNTCLMEPGDSGGGLFDLQGRIVGIHSYIAKDLSDNFDIPADWFRQYWDQLCQPKEFNPSFGIARYGVILKSERAESAGLEVAEVPQDSPAAAAGLQVGDLIAKVNGVAITPGYDINRSWRRMMPRGGGDLQLTVQRGEASESLTIQRPESNAAAVSGEASSELDPFQDLALQLAAVEDGLDDCTVRITSTKGRREVSLLGAVIRQDGLIVSKNSAVGQSPQVVDDQGRSLPARILARDESNDLILLQVDASFERAIDLTQPGSRQEGEILLSPRPGQTRGLVSIVGSRAFRSARQREIGFLGVTLELRDGKVAIKEVNGEPAKQAGLKSGDIVLKLDDLPIAEISELVNTVRSHSPGDDVQLAIRRGDDEQVVDATLGIRPPNSGMHVADEFAGGSSVRKTGFDAIFCHDAHVEPQECGGPVFDTQGEFIGINIARYSRTHCYALPAETVQKTIERLNP